MNFKNFTETVSKIFFALFFPKRCPYCRIVIKPEEYACADCIADFPQDSINGIINGKYRVMSAFLYNNNYRKAMVNFKFYNKKYYGEAFAITMAEHIKKVYADVNFDYITCVPLHNKRLKERGYNQSEVIAKNIAEILNIQYKDTLINIKNNTPQHTLSKSKRRLNVKGAYQVIDKAEIINRTILLCDDIITTGYTIGACCDLLDKSGAKEVYAISVMKALSI